MRIETMSGFAPAKSKKEETPAQSKVEYVEPTYPSVSPFEIAGLSSEQIAAKKKELAERKKEKLEEAQEERAQFLAQAAQSKWEQLYNYAIHGASNYIPAAGSIKMLTESAIKKTSEGKELGGKERMFHSIAGVSGFMFYGAMATDNLAETNLTKYGVGMSIASTLLTVLASEKGKNIIKRILKYSAEQASIAKDTAVAQSAEFFRAVDLAFDQLDTSRISEEYRQNLILELRQSNNG